MSNQIKSYFLSPSWDYPPNGPIQLGKIVMSPARVTQALNTDTLKAPPSDSLMSSHKASVTWSKQKQRAGKYGVWTEFPSCLGLGINIGVHNDKTLEDTFSFDRMGTTEFTPSDTYLQESMRSPSTLRYLEKSRYRKPIYMITGIKAVSGARAKTIHSSGKGGKLGATVDGLLTGAPVSVGPELEVERTDKTVNAFEGSSDFVFAFRVRRIMVDKNGEMKQKDFTKGALYDAEEVFGESEMPAYVQSLAGDDVSAALFPCKKICTVEDDDGELCECVILED